MFDLGSVGLGFVWDDGCSEYINKAANLSIFKLGHSWKLCEIISETERGLIESFDTLSDALEFCNTQHEDLGIVC